MEREKDIYEHHHHGTLSLVMVFIKIVVLVISIAVAIFSAIGILYGSSNESYFYMWCGQLSPIFFLANVLLTFFWLGNIRSFRFTFIINLLPAIFGSPQFINIPFGSNTTSEGKTISIVTYNVHFLENITKKGKSIMEIGSFLYETNSDFICLQEYAETPHPDEYKLPELLTDYPHSFKVLQPSKWTTTGEIILSKHPLHNRATYKLPNDSIPLMISADATIGNDTVRIFNTRLITTSLTTSRGEIEESRQSSIRKKLSSREIRDLVTSFNENAEIRHQQVTYIKKIINASPHPFILCGDMNDTPMSHTYKVLSDGITDSFKSAGKGHSYTYRGFLKMLRIDYVFHSPTIRSIKYSSPSLPYSDHNPVVVNMQLS